jgi:hypothetical protein
LVVAVGTGFLIVSGARPFDLMPAADAVPDLEIDFAGDPFTDVCVESSFA